jgi:alpha-glucosidase
MVKENWIASASIYQIYPLTFRNGASDPNDVHDPKRHYGDMQGIIDKLDYLQDTNCDALWLCPIYDSPLKDGFGYNVSDYKKIHNIFGDEQDFERLVDGAHQRGLKVILDMVFSHTSNEHYWFKESCKSRDNKFADYYVWVDPVYDTDGVRQPPNNWLSMDTKKPSAWQWNEQRQQYYLHSFNRNMPDLNINNVVVQDELLDVIDFWLAKHVDGFRMDAICHMGHDPNLPDDPVFDAALGYYGQEHKFSTKQQSGQDFLRRLKAHLDTKPERIISANKDGQPTPAYTPGVLGEILGDYSYGLELIDTKALHTVYTGSLDNNLLFFQDIIEEVYANRKDAAGINWAMSTHDAVRVVDRAMGAQARPEHAVLYMAMLAALPGGICIFQGEDMGLRQSRLKDILQADPIGLTQSFMGEADACRAALPWGDRANSALWLGTPAINQSKAPEHQVGDTKSVLSQVQALLRMRQERPALRSTTKPLFIATQDPEVVIMYREDPAHLNNNICAFNFGDTAKTVCLGKGNALTVNIKPLGFAFEETALAFNGVQCASICNAKPNSNGSAHTKLSP